MLNYATLKPDENVTYKSESKLDSYHVLKKELDDACFGVVRVDDLDIWHDDEFLLKGEPIPTLIIKNVPGNQITDRDIYLCGNLVFASCDNEGNTVSLNDKAKEIIKKFQPVRIGFQPALIYKNY